MAIRINELLALRSELSRVMFFMVVAGRRNLMFFFPPKKTVDERWEVVSAPPPKNVEQGIYEYVDCKKGPNFFKLTTW